MLKEILEKVSLGYNKEKERVERGLDGDLQIFAMQNHLILEGRIVDENKLRENLVFYGLGIFLYHISHRKKEREYEYRAKTYCHTIRILGLEEAKKNLKSRDYNVY